MAVDELLERVASGHARYLLHIRWALAFLPRRKVTGPRWEVFTDETESRSGRLRIARGGRHVGGFQTRPREYEEQVIHFFDGALLRAG